MDALHRLIIGLALAIAHIGAWPAAFVPAPAQASGCGCSERAALCVCTDCACRIGSDDPEPHPSREPVTPAPTTPRILPPDRAGLEGWTVDAQPVRERPVNVVRLTPWLGDTPFAMWCVWRT